MGHSTTFFGLSIFFFSALGVRQGTQKLGSWPSFPLVMLDTLGFSSSSANLFPFADANGVLTMVLSFFTKDCALDLCSAAASSASSFSSLLFWASYSLSRRAFSALRRMMYSKMASLSNRKPSGVMTGFRHGCKDRQQQSKSLTASLPKRIFWVP
uniref:Putative secreted protein n=1 Tax=Ixodes ricinus TaxID=34613 RepID=A0A6B0UWP8_IXORI